MSVSIVFGSDNSDPRSLNRNFTSSISVNAQIYEPTSIISPTFELDYNENILALNYFKAFNRGYFIRNISLTKAHKMVIEGYLDYMGTYSEDIKKLSCLVTRQASHRNALQADSFIPTDVSFHADFYTFSESPLTGFGSENTYVLELMGTSASSS